MADANIQIALSDLTVHGSVPADVVAQAQELALALALPGKLTPNGTRLLAQAVPIYVVEPAARTRRTEVVGGLLTYHLLLAVARGEPVQAIRVPSSQARTLAEGEQHRLLATASLFSLNPHTDFTPLRLLWSAVSRRELSAVYNELNTVKALGDYLGLPASRHRKTPAPLRSEVRTRAKGEQSRDPASSGGKGHDDG